MGNNENFGRSTPWPIELEQHPSFKKDREKIESKFSENEELTPEQKHEIAVECFKQPALFREMILENVRIPAKVKFDGGSVLYMWLNKTCPVGCEFCFYKSPKKENKPSANELTEEGVDNVINFTNDAKLDKLVLSGGGEPMLDIEKVNKLAKQIKTESFVIATSGFWAKTELNTDKYLSQLLESSRENLHQHTTFIRLSLDSGHLEKLSRGKGFEYVKNIINWFSKNVPNDLKFKLLIHTMDEETTVENLLNELSVTERIDRNDNARRSTQIQLRDGLNFGIEYSKVFDSNPLIDLKDENKETYHDEIFREFTDYLTYRRGGNMSLQFHGKNPKGLYFLLTYDGTTTIWGATPPDNETSIYKDDYQETVKKNLNDILTLGSLEKGPLYMQDIVSEINSNAVSRAVCIGLRDFYSRLLWEEDTTRLYVSIRVIQEYINEGRVEKETIDKWPKQLQALVSLDKETLKSICLESSYTIVDQYLTDPQLSAEKLATLYKLVDLGHYVITPEKMIEIVSNSKIDSKIKQDFLKNITKN